MGALWGLALGNAMGITHQERKMVAPPYPSLAEGGQTTLLGGGPKDFKPGQISSPCQAATVLSQLLREKGEYDAVAAKQAYLRWQADMKEVGIQTGPILNAYRKGEHPPWVTLRLWMTHRHKVEGNACLARVVPLGAYFSQDTEKRIRITMEDCQLTHYAPLSWLSAVALNASIACAIEAIEEAQPEDMVTAAQKDVRRAAVLYSKDHPEHALATQEAVEKLNEDLHFAGKDDPEVYGPYLHLYTATSKVRLSMRMAFWHLLHKTEFSAAMIDLANRGGDSIHHTSVTGALLGARVGADSLPTEWKETVWNALSLVFPRGPGWTRYHPRQLIELFEPRSIDESTPYREV